MPNKNKIEEMVDVLMDNLQEILCHTIDEPAGPRCGYGITEQGQHEMKFAIIQFARQVLGEYPELVSSAITLVEKWRNLQKQTEQDLREARLRLSELHQKIVRTEDSKRRWDQS